MEKISLIILLLIVSACSNLKEKNLKKICNYNSAFNVGHHDAKEKKKLNIDWANECPKDIRHRVVNGYRSGYFSFQEDLRDTTVLQGARMSSKKQCIKYYDQEVCGYNCVEAFGDVRCAKDPKFRCFEKQGEIICGYKCLEKYGEISCARYERRSAPYGSP